MQKYRSVQWCDERNLSIHVASFTCFRSHHTYLHLIVLSHGLAVDLPSVSHQRGSCQGRHPETASWIRAAKDETTRSEEREMLIVKKCHEIESPPIATTLSSGLRLRGECCDSDLLFLGKEGRRWLPNDGLCAAEERCDQGARLSRRQLQMTGGDILYCPPKSTLWMHQT